MIEIIPYQERWPSEFQAIALPLRKGLGDLALRIDHIGSTSVPGLAAKDIIDVQITVTALASDLVSKMTAMGYSLLAHITRDHRPPNAIGPEADWEKRFFRPAPGQRTANIHVRASGRANQKYALLFRDYLRAHPATAAAYAELKRRLARALADEQAYPDVKDPAVDLIYFAAEDWAVATTWQLGPRDV